tara:strand:+ start:6449 stop:7411 length:963 start_codon:yes stop_codon:yes gene_type:complete
MNYRKLAKVPLKISEIGLGTAQLSNTDNNFKGVKHVPLTEAKKILSTAIERGVNFFDTAINYGNAQSLLKEIKRDYKDSIIIACKVGLGKNGIRDFSISSLNNQIENTLNEIDIDTIDLLQLNKPTQKDLENGELFEFLENLKREGRVKHTGVVVGDTDTGYTCIKSKTIDCLQIMYNLLFQETEKLIEKTKQDGLGIIIRSPLNNGLLSGTFSPKQEFDPNDERADYFSGPIFEKRLEKLKKIQESLEIEDRDLIDYSLRFILSNKNVSTVIPGFSKVSQLDHCLDNVENFLPFKPEELLNIKNTVSENLKDSSFIVQN